MTERQRHRRAGWVGWMIAGVIAAAACVPIFAFRSTTELDVYMEAAQRLVDGAEIYRIAPGTRTFSYPAIFAAVMTPLLPLPETGRRIGWCVVNVMLAVATLFILWRIVRPWLSGSPARERSRLIFWILTGLLGARFLLAPLSNQSHDLFLAVLVALCAWCSIERREIGAGLAVGLAASLKATPLLFVPMFIVQRRWRAAAAALVAAGVFYVGPDLILPRADGGWNALRWVEMTREAATPGRSGDDQIWSPWNHLNQNVSGTIYRLTHHPPPWYPSPDPGSIAVPDGVRTAVTLTLQGAVVLILLAVGIRAGPPSRAPADQERWQHLAETGLVAAAMILLSPMSSKAHYCVLLVGVAAVVLPFVVLPRTRRALGVALGLLFLTGTLTSKEILGQDLGNTLLAYGSTMLSCAVLFVTLAVLRWRVPEGIAPP